MTPELLVKHLGAMFQDISSWPSDEQVRSYYIGIERELVRCPAYSSLRCFFKSSYSNILNVGFG
jgi:hypothetical protein